MAKRTRRDHAAFAAALTLVLASARPASAVTYYVRASGSDTADGMSPATAFASIRFAGRLMRAPGDRVIVGPGTYYEGNIEPLGSGVPDAPIEFLADPSGASTGDPPGTVMILPPNTEDATTGFIVFGRHDIAIEGFFIDGADDAGIQVRPHFSTGVDSTRVTARNNVVLNSGRRGIQMTAVGDVGATGNTVIGNPTVAFSFDRGESGEVRPTISGNTVEGTGRAISIEGAFGLVISQNQLRSSLRGPSVRVVTARGITMRGNQGGSIFLSGVIDVELADNLFGKVRIEGSGAIRVTGNTIAGSALTMVLDAGATVEALDNELQATFIHEAGDIDFERNRGRALTAGGSRNVTIVDNRMDLSLQASAGVKLEVSRNQAHGLTLGGAEAVVVSNELQNRLFILADTATVTGNTSRFLTIEPRPGVRPEDVPDAAVLIEDNTTRTALRAVALKRLEVRHNQASGIMCFLADPDSELIIADNTSQRAEREGISVRGAGSALVENNTAYDNEDTGFAAFRVRALTVVGNDFSLNKSGGLLLRTPLAGDCDGDLRVAVDELARSVGIVLGQVSLYDCQAADFDADERVTVDELVLAANAALGRVEPGQPELLDSQIEIRSNRVEGNLLHGIKVTATGAVSALDNTVLGNDGIAIAVRARGLVKPVEIAGNVLGLGGGEGVFVEGVTGASVRDNVIFSNREAGILLRDAPDAALVNNLVYRNGNDGIAVGLGSTRPVSRARIVNNTLYANGDWGVTIGSGDVPSTDASILNNILDGNGKGGIAAQSSSLPGLSIGFNLNRDGYAHGITPSVTDFVADPRFISPAGPDGILGGEGFEDDDFHVRGEGPPSAVIDAGSAPAEDLAITGSVVAGRSSDAGIVDLGFHYGAVRPTATPAATPSPSATTNPG